MRESFAFYIFLAALIGSPLLFGAVAPVGYSYMALMVVAGSVLTLACSVEKDPRGRWGVVVPATGFNLGFVLIAAYLVLQVCPLPGWLIEWLSPEAARINGMGGGVLSETAFWGGSAGSPGIGSGLAPYRLVVRQSLVRFVLYGLFFFGMVRLLTSRRRIETALMVVVLLGCFETIYGMVQTYSGANMVWNYQKQSNLPFVSGTFVHRNQFAGFQMMCLTIAAAYGLVLRSGLKGEGDGIDGRNRAKRFARNWLRSEKQIGKRTVALICGLAAGTGILLSGSRGGILSSTAGLFFLGFMIAGIRRTRLRIGLFAALVAMILLVSHMIGMDNTLGRFSDFGEHLSIRHRFTQGTLALFSDYPIFGTGVGAFRWAFHPYQSAHDWNRFLRHAHNDWAQLLAEAGIVGFALAGFGFYRFFRGYIITWRRRHSIFARGVGAGGLAVAVALAVYSYSDFSLHIPANALMLAACLAIGVSAVHLSNRNGREKSLLDRHFLVLTSPKGAAGIAVIAGLIAWVGLTSSRHIAAEYHYIRYQRDGSKTAEVSMGRLDKAGAIDSVNAAYFAKWGQERARHRNRLWTTLSPNERRDSRMEIIAAYESAVRLNPFDAETHCGLAWEYLGLSLRDSHIADWLSAADSAAKRATYLVGVRQALHESLAQYWLTRSKMTSPADAQWPIFVQQAKEHLQQVLTHSNNRRDRYRLHRMLLRYYPDESFLEGFE
jgi:O-antigen ligase